jgi:hypothetical protein
MDKAVSAASRNRQADHALIGTALRVIESKSYIERGL